MLPPTPFPDQPAAAADQLRQAIVAATNGREPMSRDVALDVFRRHLARVQGHVRDVFEQGNLPGLKAARLLSDLTDGLISALFDYAVSLLPGVAKSGKLKLTIAASGGYGRAVLAPFSDLDLLFLTPDRRRMAFLGKARAEAISSVSWNSCSISCGISG